MKRYSWRIFILQMAFLQLCACKKDELIGLTTADTAFKFGIVGEMYPAIKNQSSSTLDIIIPQDSSKTHLQAYFTVPAQATLMANNVAIYSQKSRIDYTQPVQLNLVGNILQPDNNWTVNVKKASEAFGLGSVVSEAKSLSSNRDYYFDQYQSGPYASSNCGPAVASMAAKWANANFDKNPKEARSAIHPQGGAWKSSEVTEYLQMQSVNTTIVYLANLENVVKKNIDKGNLLILALDIFYIKQNNHPIEKVGKTYAIYSKGTGHFIVVKGYKVVDGQFFLEVYDPNSGGAVYQLNQESKGKDRYFATDQVQKAIQDWWNYAIVVVKNN